MERVEGTTTHHRAGIGLSKKERSHPYEIHSRQRVPELERKRHQSKNAEHAAVGRCGAPFNNTSRVEGKQVPERSLDEHTPL
jgi:hypothetical protein